MPQLKYHVLLDAERLAELQASEGDTWSPVCENMHKETVYAEYVTEVGGLLCAGCTFCRECERELEYTICQNHECRLYLKGARAKDA